MRSRHLVAVLVLTLLGLGPWITHSATDQASAASRHRFYVGTIVAISSNALTIHSKTHATDYHFVIDRGTQFLRHAASVPRTLFKVGSYVTVSYSTAAHNIMVAWHVSLRKRESAKPKIDSHPPLA